VRKVFTSESFPQIVKVPNRLNQSPTGTVGFPSIQFCISYKLAIVMSRVITRSSKCSSRAGEMLARWIFGMAGLTVKTCKILLLQFLRFAWG